MNTCQDCIKGVRHEGIPEGNITTIGGVQCYVATPQGIYARHVAILFLPDAFGMQLENSQLLADDFAKNGFKTVLVDIFEGDPVPINLMDANAAPPSFDLQAWFSRHSYEAVCNLINRVVLKLKEDGITTLGATGYCFGGRYVLDLAIDNVICAASVAHPSLLEIPTVFEKLLASSRCSLLFNTCEIDQQFPIETQKLADEYLGNNSYTPGYERTYWEGCTHGFAVRGDMSNPKIKAGKEGAFVASVRLFHQKL